MERQDTLQRLGKSFLQAVDHGWGILSLAKDCIVRLSELAQPAVRDVFLRQVYFTGVEAVTRVSLIGALTGVVIITQVSSFVGLNAEVTSKVLVWTVVRELGPLLAAIIVISRSGTAIAAELGSMRAGGEIKYIAAMGIDPLAYLVMPRIAGMVVSLAALTVYFQLAATFGGLALSSLIFPIPFLAQTRNLYANVSLLGLFVSLVKSIIFGLVVAACSCYHGLRVRTSITEIPQVTTWAVMQGLTLVVLINGAITLSFFI